MPDEQTRERPMAQAVEELERIVSLAERLGRYTVGPVEAAECRRVLDTVYAACEVDTSASRAELAELATTGAT